MVDSFLGYHLLNILMSILTRIWPGRSMFDNYVYQRVQSSLHCLYHLHPLTNAFLGELYCTYVLPVLYYCDVVWSPSPVQYFKRFKCINSKFCSECRKLHTAVIVYKILHQFSPAYLRGTFNIATTVTSHVGRNSHRLFVPWVRNTCGKNSLCYKGTQIWNSLNALLYSAATLKQLKTFI